MAKGDGVCLLWTASYSITRKKNKIIKKEIRR